jgi:Holliday junction DNA helicase RuvA
MIEFLKGVVVDRIAESPTGAAWVLEVQGVGWRILTTPRSVHQGPGVGDAMQVYTHCWISDTEWRVVGFASRDARDLFRLLQSASGVGVKVALSLMEAFSVSELAQAIAAGQHQCLTQAKGVGNKLAQRIVLEVREKLQAWQPAGKEGKPGRLQAGGKGFATGPASGTAPGPDDVAAGAAWYDTSLLLRSLGYGEAEIEAAFGALAIALDPAQGTAEILTREALRWLSSPVAKK